MTNKKEQLTKKELASSISKSLKFLPNFDNSEIEVVNHEIGDSSFEDVQMIINFEKKFITVDVEDLDNILVVLYRNKRKPISTENDSKYCKSVEEVKNFILTSNFIE